VLIGREKVCFQQLSESCCADRGVSQISWQSVERHRTSTYYYYYLLLLLLLFNTLGNKDIYYFIILLLLLLLLLLLFCTDVMLQVYQTSHRLATLCRQVPASAFLMCQSRRKLRRHRRQFVAMDTWGILLILASVTYVHRLTLHHFQLRLVRLDFQAPSSFYHRSSHWNLAHRSTRESTLVWRCTLYTVSQKKETNIVLYLTFTNSNVSF